MKNQMKVIALLAAIAATPTQAATWALSSSETYNSSTNTGGDCITDGASYGNARHCIANEAVSPGAVPTIANATLVVTAWSNTAATSLSGTASSTTNTLIESAYVGVYSGGLGVTNKDGNTATTGCDTNQGTYDQCEGTPTNTNPPEHTVDNNGRYDSLLFTFDSKVALDKITTGYVSGDSDISLWVYDALGTPDISGKTYSSLGAGWILVGNYDGTTSSSGGTMTVNTGSTVYSSSYWLIGAYNSAAAAGTCYKADGTTGGTCSLTSLDYFKVASVSDKQVAPPAPEPATLGLLGLGLLGMTHIRRKRQSV